MRASPLRAPWTRLLLSTLVAGPALWIGGVDPALVPAFLAVAALLWLRLLTRRRARVTIPRVAGLGLVLIVVTALQWLPLPHAARATLAPEVAARTGDALAGLGIDVWPSLSPTPGDTALESARLVGLLALFLAAAQLSWRVSAAAVAATGTLVSLIGLVHAATSSAAIYGLYHAVDVDLEGRAALLTSFVNPNHQSGLLLLGLFSAAGLAVALRTRAGGDHEAQARRREWRWALTGALALQGVALLLSLSNAAILALCAVTPIALWLTRGGPRREAIGARLSVAVGLSAVAALIVHARVWSELSRLSRLTDPDFDTKLRVARDALALVGRGALGIGRGGFLDLFPQVDARPSAAVFTHLECAPAAMVVEWGPAVGGIALVSLTLWWIRSVRASESAARRVALCGLLALAIQSLADFSLEFLGVAAPACALAGGLSHELGARTLGRAPAAALLLPTLAAFTVLSVISIPHTWSRRDRDPSDVAALRTRPLDARLHVALARAAGERGDWAEAAARAEVAARLRPGDADAWLVRSAAARALGDEATAAEALARALSQWPRKPGPALAAYLVDAYPDPAALAEALPRDPLARARILTWLAAAAPRYAQALGIASDDRSLAALELRTRIALELGDLGLALHLARLRRAQAPDATAALLLAEALGRVEPPRLREAAALLEEARASVDPADAYTLACLEEQLIRALARLDGPDDRARARALLSTLERRPGDARARRRRIALREALDG